MLKKLALIVLVVAMLAVVGVGLTYGRLMNSHWQFDRAVVDGQATTFREFGIPPEGVTLTFYWPPRFSGYDGCNNFRGMYMSSVGGYFRTGSILQTALYCERGYEQYRDGKLLETIDAIPISDALVDGLRNSQAYELRDGSLWIFFDDRSNALVFQPAAP